MNILVTGAAGFIGSALCRYLIGQGEHRVIAVDSLTYAGNLGSLKAIDRNANFKFYHANIRDQRKIASLLEQEKIGAVFHLAAESHVDRSIERPDEFIDTNIIGTYRLLNAALSYWRRLDRHAQSDFRFVHVSTDEVFGDLPFDGSQFSEASSYAPSSPYSASKAAADHLVRAWYHSYSFPVIITNCANNYGPYHYPEKLIPLAIINALKEQPIPIYGDGRNVRDWLYVEDHVQALSFVFKKGKIGETYLVGARSERSNIQVINSICDLMDVLRPRGNGLKYCELIQFVKDRPGHDRRYAIDPSKIEKELDWKANVDFSHGLQSTILWFLENKWWWQPSLENQINETTISRNEREPA